jgi:hypothetical protein
VQWLKNITMTATTEEGPWSKFQASPPHCIHGIRVQGEWSGPDLDQFSRQTKHFRPKYSTRIAKNAHTMKIKVKRYVPPQKNALTAGGFQ